jgi:hypothetical protein
MVSVAGLKYFFNRKISQTLLTFASLSQGLMEQFKQKTRDLIESSGIVRQHMANSQGTDGTRRVLFQKLVDSITKSVSHFNRPHPGPQMLMLG